MRDHVEGYLSELRETRDSGRAVDETSSYLVLVKLLNEVGRTLKPKVCCILTPRNAGSGIGDASALLVAEWQIPVIKKWLSYRESNLLGRPLRKEEVREVTDIARRIAAILLMEPDLDANYRTSREHPYPWPHEG